MILPLLIVPIITYLFLLTIAVLLLFGKGGILLSGYNYKAEEKAKKYERYLLKRAGIFMVVFSSCLFVAMMFGTFKLMIGLYVSIGITFLCLILGIITLNTKKMRRVQFLTHKLSEDPYYIDGNSKNNIFK